MSKTVLVLGATGAMGKYLIPQLAERGYEVTAVYREDWLTAKGLTSDAPNVHYVPMDVMEPGNYDSLMSKHYDGIVDFMIYNTAKLPIYLPRALAATDHYIYFSSYRVYDGKDVPVREYSRRLIDSTENAWLKHSDDYSIYKARGEEMLKVSPRRNWTAVRPSIIYSLQRNQLVTLEANLTTARARAGRSTVLPVQAKDIQGTRTWAGDAARMLAGLLFNELALGEVYSIATAEHHTWGEIAEMYHDICGLNSVWVDKEDYLKLVDPHGGPGARWQLEYDRLFNRVMDNSKVLHATGITQDSLRPLYDGLAYEIGRFPKDDPAIACDSPVSIRFNDFLAQRGLR